MVNNKSKFYVKAGLTVTQMKIIDFYELQWHLRHNVPTVEEVVEHINAWHIREKHHNRTTLTAVNYYLQRRPMIKALTDRGIPFQQHTQSELTATQVAAAITVMNFADTRSTADKLDQLGINNSQYYAWLNEPQFKNLVENLADQNLKNIRPTAIGELTKKINSGDWQAIKFYLETTGAATDDVTPNSEVMLRMIIEVIQRHVKDPETMLAIAEDLRLVTSNRTLEVVRPQEITSTAVVHDTDLAVARKKLGV